MNQDFKFYDDPFEIFFRAYHKDKNFASKYPLFIFNKHSKEYLQIPDSTNETTSTIERFVHFDNLNDLNKVFYYPNTYSLWSDCIKLNDKSNIIEMFKELYWNSKNKNELDEKLSMNTISKKSSNSLLRKISSLTSRLDVDPKPELKKILVMQSLCSRKAGYIPEINKLVVGINAIHEFDKIRNLDTAFEFLDKYGTDYPICDYTLFRFTIKIIEVMSYDTSDVNILKKIGIETLKSRNFKTEYQDEIVYERKMDSSTSLIPKYRFKLRFLKIKTLPPFFRASVKNSESVKWEPIYNILERSFNKHEIDSKYLNFVRHAWFLRNANYGFMSETFFNFTKLFEESRNTASGNLDYYLEKYKSIEDYWTQVVYSNVKSKFIKYMIWELYSKYSPEYINDKTLKNLVDVCFTKELKFFIRQIESMINKNVFHLAKEEKLDEFIKKKYKHHKISILYYDKNLISSLANIWSNLFANFVNYIESDNQNNMGLLINYDLHPESKVFSYKKDFYVENIFQIPKNQNESCLDYKNQKRIAFNDIELNWNISKLDLSENSFVSLNKLVFNSSYYSFFLKELYLRQSAILFIEEGTFDNFYNLEVLDLSDNRLVMISANIFKNLSTLRELDLSESRTQSVHPEAFKNLRKLTKLNLSKNELRLNENDSYFINLESLEVLNLSHNQITNFKSERVFLNLNNLKQVYLNSNRIVKLNELMFSRAHKLEILHLGNNMIKHVTQKLFYYLPNLNALYLNDNLINTIDENVFIHLENLKFLFLHCNPLENLTEKIFNPLISLNAITLFKDEKDQSKVFKNLIDSKKNAKLEYNIHNFNLAKIKALYKSFQNDQLIKEAFFNRYIQDLKV